MTDREVKLAEAFRRGMEAAKAVQEGDDGGSANFDSVVLHAKRGLTARTVETAAASAGLSASRRTGGMWSGWFLSFGAGQGAMNTRMVEAAADAMRSAGEDVSVYYRID